MKLHTVRWYGSSSEEEVEIEIEAKNIDDALDKAVNLHRNESHTRIHISDGSFFGSESFDNPNYAPVEKNVAADNQPFTSLVSSILDKLDASAIYRFAGWLCIGVGFIVLIAGLVSDGANSDEEGFVFFCYALLAAWGNFFAAHILRLQEKTAAFTEVTAGIMEKHHELMVENVNLLRSIAQKTEDKG